MEGRGPNGILSTYPVFLESKLQLGIPCIFVVIQQLLDDPY